MIRKVFLYDNFENLLLETLSILLNYFLQVLYYNSLKKEILVVF